jgi:predicted PolB exonuclease-like 3'-5' exonuclease
MDSQERKHKKMMKAFRRLSPQEQARLEEMLGVSGRKKATDDEQVWSQFEADLKKWHRLYQTSRRG